MAKQKPIIGITMGHIASKHWRGVYDVASIPLSFVDLICRNGGVPMAIPNNPSGLHHILPMVDGLLFVGGDDLAPSRYTKDPAHPSIQEFVPERDETELKIVRSALRRNMPVLGVCRGCQVLNVALGGTLHQHLLDGVTTRNHSQFESEHPERTIWHHVNISPGSRIAKIVGSTRLRVNSDHHQGIDRVGKGLEVTARSTDDIIEGIEGTEWGFVLGLQWHPERIFGTHPIHGRFFKRFVSAAKASAEPA